jgi:hypothetical protein
MLQHQLDSRYGYQLAWLRAQQSWVGVVTDFWEQRFKLATVVAGSLNSSGIDGSLRAIWLTAIHLV